MLSSWLVIPAFINIISLDKAAHMNYDLKFYLNITHDMWYLLSIS